MGGEGLGRLHRCSGNLFFVFFLFFWSERSGELPAFVMEMFEAGYLFQTDSLAETTIVALLVMALLSGFGNKLRRWIGGNNNEHDTKPLASCDETALASKLEHDSTSKPSAWSPKPGAIIPDERTVTHKVNGLCMQLGETLCRGAFFVFFVISCVRSGFVGLHTAIWSEMCTRFVSCHIAVTSRNTFPNGHC